MNRRTENEKLIIKLKLVKNLMAQKEVGAAKTLRKLRLETNRSAENVKEQKPKLELFNDKFNQSQEKLQIEKFLDSKIQSSFRQLDFKQDVQRKAQLKDYEIQKKIPTKSSGWFQ